MTEPDALGGETRSSRGLRWALALSVALNLAVAGTVAGVYVKYRNGGFTGASHQMGFGPIAGALRPEDRRALRRALLARAPEMGQTRARTRAELRKILGVLRADPLDEGQLRGLLAAQGTRMSGQMDTARGLIGDFLVALPSDERRAFADRLEASLKRGKDGR